METVSYMVKKFAEDQPFIMEALARGIINYGNLALEFKPKIESALGKQITDSAIIMALRRFAEEIKGRVNSEGDLKLACEIMMKTNICDFNFAKTPALLTKIKKIYDLASLERGDFLNITIGNHEISIAISQKHKDEIVRFLDGETILNQQKDLVALTLLFDGDFLHTHSVVYQIMRRLAWMNINIFEIISTHTELTIIVGKSDSIKSYEVLQEFAEKLATDS